MLTETINEKELLIEKSSEGKYEKWNCTFSPEQLYEALYEFEAHKLVGIGFSGTTGGAYRAEGWAGKPAACYDTGRHVCYRGKALAVLDDDNHFIFRSMKICEKTANVYMLPVYRNILEVSNPDLMLFAKLGTDPVLFNCDTFQEDSAAVAKQIKYEREMPEKSLIYCGPFRCIFLTNGTIIRRGIPVAISGKSAELLDENEYIPLATHAPAALNYLDLYRKYGSIFLLDNSFGSSVNSFPQPKAITTVSDTLKERLRNMINQEHDYFILQGSDPADPESCCPNALVPELNRLIQAGLVSSWTSETAGTCPMTVYTFSGELKLKNGSFPAFSKNVFLRQAISKYL